MVENNESLRLQLFQLHLLFQESHTHDATVHISLNSLGTVFNICSSRTVNRRWNGGLPRPSSKRQVTCVAGHLNRRQQSLKLAIFFIVFLLKRDHGSTVEILHFTNYKICITMTLSKTTNLIVSISILVSEYFHIKSIVFRHRDGFHLKFSLQTLEGFDRCETQGLQGFTRFLHLFDARWKWTQSTTCKLIKKQKKILADYF